jgi:hypothetical protein
MMAAIVRKLQYYPFIIVFAWGPSTATDIIYEFADAYDETFGAISTVCATSQGLLTAVLFFYYNDDVRNMWISLFSGAKVNPNYELESGSGSGPAKGNGYQSKKSGEKSATAKINRGASGGLDAPALVNRTNGDDNDDSGASAVTTTDAVTATNTSPYATDGMVVDAVGFDANLKV